MEQVNFILFFAVKEEVKYLASHSAECETASHRVVVTGIGRKNACEGVHSTLQRYNPERVLTCGFAGGLNPKLPVGTVVFEEDFDMGLTAALLDLGAQKAKFHCSRRVAITAEEKQTLWDSTGADVVEMESSVIRNLCREQGIPSATIRVISDSAHDDLPLDFNALMTSNDRINFAKLAWTLVLSPGKIRRLIDFQRQTIDAARHLAGVIDELLQIRRNC